MSSRTTQLLIIVCLVVLSCVVLVNIPNDHAEKLIELQQVLLERLDIGDEESQQKGDSAAAVSQAPQETEAQSVGESKNDKDSIQSDGKVDGFPKVPGGSEKREESEDSNKPDSSSGTDKGAELNAKDSPQANTETEIVTESQEHLDAMLKDLTKESMDQHYSLQAKSVDAHVSMRVPKLPDPLPTFMVEYAWRDFATNTSVHSTTCPITCQVEVIPGTEKWTMKTFDIQGRPKAVGGDEFAIFYSEDMAGSTDAVARAHDQQDGTYELVFHKTPDCRDPLKGVGTLRIVLVFSCDLGMVAPPAKKNWNTGAFAITRYDIHNMTAPFMHGFVPPNTDHAIDFAQYGKILVHGDSTMNHFVGNFPRMKPFHGDMIMWNGGNRHALYKSTVETVMSSVRGHMAWMVDISNRTAFVYGSSAWDVNIDPEGLHGADFANQLNASQLLVETMRKEFPTVDIYWRSGLAEHPHLSSLNMGKIKKNWYTDERNKYLSDGRVHQLYRSQKELMQKLNVTWLDMYPATFACVDHHENGRIPGDAVHYTADWNRVMTGWFYPNEKTVKH